MKSTLEFFVEEVSERTSTAWCAMGTCFAERLNASEANRLCTPCDDGHAPFKIEAIKIHEWIFPTA